MSEIAAMSSEERAHQRARQQDVSFQMAVWRAHGLVPESVRRKGRPTPPSVSRDILDVNASTSAPTETEAHRIVREVIEYVCDKYNIHPNALKSVRREVVLVQARHEAMWLLKQMTSMSMPQIGRALGGRDHTTVLHGLRKHEARMLAAGASA